MAGIAVADRQHLVLVDGTRIATMDDAGGPRRCTIQMRLQLTPMIARLVQ